MGIMNTTVNFTYQFLTKKFDIFSQFLFDEYIKSYLQREKRWYKKHRDDEEVDNKYPFNRAFQFNKDIRKLGVSDSGKTFLDQFRMLITEIGNALGYVRMVRSAGMNYCSNAIKFVPDLNHTHFKFEAYAGDGVAETNEESGEVVRDAIVGAKLSRETVVAARNLDSVISTLAKNFSENNDYFKVLVKVFQDVTASDEQKHLVNFYAILPALTINYVETTVQAKDLMYKNTRRRESYFSDDGFAIGVAYILAILDQGDVRCIHACNMLGICCINVLSCQCIDSNLTRCTGLKKWSASTRLRKKPTTRSKVSVRPASASKRLRSRRRLLPS